MSEITIRPFKEADRKGLYNFKLSDVQLQFTSLPKEVLDDAINDEMRTPTVVVNEHADIVGFFVLHKYYQHEGYDTPHEVVYVRSLSVNEQMQGRGYGTKIALEIPSYVQENFSNFDTLYLAVDSDNEAAWNLYERAGFIHSATKEHGPVGKERLYYLDLGGKYVTNIKLKLSDEATEDYIKIDIVLNGEVSVGYIEGDFKAGDLVLNDVYIHESQRQKGYASSALRQLSTFLRRDIPKVKTLVAYLTEIDGEERLLENTGFARFDYDDGTHVYKKLVNY